MNAVAIKPEIKLPVTVEDLSRFVLIGREKLAAVRAEIRAIEKVGLAKAVHEQKKAEGQALAEAVLDAEVRIGQLMREVPKAQGLRTDLQLCDSGVEKFQNSKDLKIKTDNCGSRTCRAIKQRKRQHKTSGGAGYFGQDTGQSHSSTGY